MRILKSMVLFFTLGLLLVLTPNFANAEQGDTIPEGNQESIRIPIVEPEDSSEDSLQKFSAASTNNIGYVDVWVTNNPKKINWEVVVYAPYKGNGFTGHFSITNLSTGLSHGSYDITGMKGSISPPIYRGKYGGRLSGVLLYNGVTTGVTLSSPYLVWTI
ncbi:hypothetical protein KHA94_13535 [Bacillus sp. FJAT-49705]|uniref:DUF5626 domain-containing protein n=1 Tax=Cytobacillus citreus TaxID=2833586 RepID=A0ABS5NTN9_9BACI|nr:hypothetical protein [Cytobacillus citreus]MBS4191206.1 hypothetical protein [Cytobacillus citreus]